jgi:hypothetical protein
MSLPAVYHLSFFSRTLSFVHAVPESVHKENSNRFRLAFKLNRGDLLSYTCVDCLEACAPARLGEFTSPAFAEKGAEAVPEPTRRWMENHTRLHKEMLDWARTRMRSEA